MNEIVIFLLGTAVAGPIGFFAKRYFEKAATNEEIRRFGDLVAISKGMKEANLTVPQIIELRRQLLKQCIEIEIDGAEGEDLSKSEPDDEEESELISRTRARVCAELDAGDPIDFGDGPQQTMNLQQAERLERANTILRRVVSAMRAELADSSHLALFNSTQRSWEAFRRAQSEFASLDAEGGSMRPMLWSGEATAMAIDRIAAIQTNLELRQRWRRLWGDPMG